MRNNHVFVCRQMASLIVSRPCSEAVEDSSCTHALVEFIEEECTGVVPLKRFYGDSFQAGVTVTVLWNDRKEYAAVFLYSGSKKQCQEEEDRVLDEEAIHICDEDIEMENNESSDSETPEDEGNEDEDKENTDKGTDNAENQNPKRKRRLIKNKDDRQSNFGTGDKDNVKKRKTDGDKENNKKSNRRKKDGDKEKRENDEAFIVRVGRSAMRTVSFNISDVLYHDAQNNKDTRRKEIEPYCGQAIELYSSDEENDQFYRCCVMVEQDFTFAGQPNKHNTIPVEDVQGHQRSSDPPIHYTGGAKEIDLEKNMDTLRTMVQNNEQKRDIVCKEIREVVLKISDKFEETQKTLALILTKLINPNAVQVDGFAPPPGNTITPVTPATTPVTSSTAPPAPSTNTITPVTPATTQVTSSTAPSAPSTNTITPVTPTTTPVTSSTAPPAPSTNTTTPVTPATTPVASSTATLVDTVIIPANALTSPVNFEEVQPSSNAGSTGILVDNDIQHIKKKSCSRKNFASRLVHELFDEDTRRKSNVASKLGKLKLNPVLMEYVKSIKSITFQYYPLEQHEKEKDEWAQCIISIDEANRRKPKKLAM